MLNNSIEGFITTDAVISVVIAALRDMPEGYTEYVNLLKNCRRRLFWMTLAPG